jgi:hypothetical protein
MVFGALTGRSRDMATRRPMNSESIKFTAVNGSRVSFTVIAINGCSAIAFWNDTQLPVNPRVNNRLYVAAYFSREDHVL